MNEGKTLGELQADVLGLKDDLEYMEKAYDSAVVESDNLRDQIYDYQETLNNLKEQMEVTVKIVRESVRKMRDVLWELDDEGLGKYVEERVKEIYNILWELEHI